MSYNNTGMKIVNQLAKPLENMAITYLGARYLLGVKSAVNLPLIGRMSDGSMGLSLVAGVSSLGTELIHNFVLPNVVDGSQLYSASSMLLNPTLLALGLYSITSYGDPAFANNTGGLKLMLLGAGSEIGSAYVNDGFIQPWVNNSSGY